MGLAETGTKTELSQLGLEIRLILSLEDIPRGVGGVEQNWKYSSAQLGLELGKKAGTELDQAQLRLCTTY